MITDPQPVQIPDGYGLYWSCDLNDAEWEVWVSAGSDDVLRIPSFYDEEIILVFARRRPWVPKIGDRVWYQTPSQPGTVRAVEDEWCWVWFDHKTSPSRAMTPFLTPLVPGGDQ